MNKQTVINFAKDVSRVLKKHSPELLTGIGIVGMISTAVTAVRATPKALQLIDEKEIKENQRLGAAEIVKTTWKCYVPAAVTGTLSIACLIGASAVNSKRNAALATAYAISEGALKDYKEKALEVVGPKKEQAIRDAVAKDKIAKDPVSSKEVIVTENGDTLCYDVLSGRYFRSSIEVIRQKVNEINRQMLRDQYVSLNDFYYEIGLPGIKLGKELGWNIDKGLMDVQFGSHLNEQGTPCLVIDYMVAPQYGYDILSIL